MGLPSTDILSFWLGPDERDSAFLEVIQHMETPQASPNDLARPGYGHTALAIDDMEETRHAIPIAGGQSQGALTDLGSPRKPIFCIDMRDPEGNVLELEQAASL